MSNVNFSTNQGGNNIYTNVYSNVNGNRNNFNFNEEIINNNDEQRSPEQEHYDKQIKELKNYKYKQLLRAKYSDYAKTIKEDNRNHQE